MQVKTITPAKLTQILLDRKIRTGMSLFASITIETDARLKKTGNPYPNVRKQSKMTVMLNTKYVSRVHNQLEREGRDKEDYVAGRNTMPLTFGENNNIVGFFNGQAVLQFSPFDNSHPEVTYFTEEGFIVKKEDIEAFMPKSNREPVYNNQGTEKEIIWRKTYMENVLEMTLDGVKYVVQK